MNFYIKTIFVLITAGFITTNGFASYSAQYPLHHAVNQRDLSSINTILATNPEAVNKEDYNGRTPLELFIFHFIGSFNCHLALDIINTLLMAGADPFRNNAPPLSITNQNPKNANYYLMQAIENSSRSSISLRDQKNILAAIKNLFLRIQQSTSQPVLPESAACAGDPMTDLEARLMRLIAD